MSNDIINYNFEMKPNGVTPGTFGAKTSIPIITVTNKGLITKLGATNGIYIPPLIRDFTISGLNNANSPLFSSLEFYDPNRSNTSNGSGFIGNYGKNLYALSALKIDSASGSFNIGAKSNSLNDNNINNISIGQLSMVDSFSDHAIAIGTNAMAGSTKTKAIHIGHNNDLGYAIGKEAIQLGSSSKLNTGDNNITIGSNQNNYSRNTEPGLINIGSYNNGQLIAGTTGIIISNNTDLSLPNTSYNPSFQIKLSNSQFISSYVQGNNVKLFRAMLSLENSEIIDAGDNWDMLFPVSISSTFYTLVDTVMIGTSPKTGIWTTNQGVKRSTLLGRNAAFNLTSAATEPFVKNSTTIGNLSLADNDSVSIGYNSGRYNITDSPTRTVPFTSGFNTAGVWGRGVTYAPTPPPPTPPPPTPPPPTPPPPTPPPPTPPPPVYQSCIYWRQATYGQPDNCNPADSSYPGIGQAFQAAHGSTVYKLTWTGRYALYSRFLYSTDLAKEILFCNNQYLTYDISYFCCNNGTLINGICPPNINSLSQSLSTGLISESNDSNLSLTYGTITPTPSPDIKTATAYGNGPLDTAYIADGIPASDTIPFLIDVEAVMVSRSQASSIILTSDGRLYSVGLNTDGQLGYAVSPNPGFYELIPWSVANPCSYVTTVGTFTVVIRASDKTLWGIGRYNDISFTDFTLISTDAWESISINYITISFIPYYFMAGIKSDGHIYTTGANNLGQLGQGYTGGSSPTFIFTQVDTNIYSKVTCGGSHVVALRSDGKAVTWGNNNKGQLGSNNTTASDVPLVIDNSMFNNKNFPADTSTVIDIDASDVSSCLVTANNNAFVTGYLDPFFSELKFSRVQSEIGGVKVQKCKFAGPKDIIFTLTDKTFAGFGKGLNAVFFTELNPTPAVPKPDLRTSPAQLLFLSTLSSKNKVILPNSVGSTQGNSVVTASDVNGRGQNRICIASKGRQYPFTICIGNDTSKIGAPDGSGVETTATAGAASGLPSNPAAYLRADINKKFYKIPLFNV